MHKRVFFDTSVIIAALLSQGGASYRVLSELSDDFEFVVNEYVFVGNGVRYHLINVC